MATDTNKFKIFLEKYYNSSFNTKRSGKNNPITKVNSCVVNDINKVIEPEIRDFELSMPQECYTTLSENPTTNDIQRCVSQYGQFNDGILVSIQSCLSVQPTTTTTTILSECSSSVTFDVTVEGCVTYTDCCGRNMKQDVRVGSGVTIIECLQINTLTSGGVGCKTSPASIENIVYNGFKCRCSPSTTTTSTSTSTTTTTTIIPK